MQKFGRVNQKKNRYSLLFEIMSQVIKRKNTHRIFLGIFPQKEHISFFRDILRNLDEEKRNLKHIPLDMVHLTLYFIGANVSESSLQKIIKLFESKKDYGNHISILNQYQYNRNLFFFFYSLNLIDAYT